MFTGNKDADRIVLSQLDDYDLANACASNKHLNEICRDETFWRNRTLRRFGSYLGNISEIKEYMKASRFTSWKKYYIYLIDFIEKIYGGRIFNIPSRKDLQKLASIIKKNDVEMIENIVRFVSTKLENRTWDNDRKSLQPFLEQQLKKDLINPNVLFNADVLREERIGEQIKFLLQSKDKRIKPDYSDYYWFEDFATDHEYRYDDAAEIFQLIIDDERIDPNVLFQVNTSYRIVTKYLYILAQSNRIQSTNYPNLLKLLTQTEDAPIPKTFKQYASLEANKLSKVFNKLNEGN